MEIPLQELGRVGSPLPSGITDMTALRQSSGSFPTRRHSLKSALQHGAKHCVSLMNSLHARSALIIQIANLADSELHRLQTRQIFFTDSELHRKRTPLIAKCTDDEYYTYRRSTEHEVHRLRAPLFMSLGGLEESLEMRVGDFGIAPISFVKPSDRSVIFNPRRQLSREQFRRNSA